MRSISRLSLYLGSRGNRCDMVTPMTTELKAWFFLGMSVVLLLFICGLAMLGLLTRPMRWSERP